MKTPSSRRKADQFALMAGEVADHCRYGRCDCAKKAICNHDELMEAIEKKEEEERKGIMELLAPIFKRAARPALALAVVGTLSLFVTTARAETYNLTDTSVAGIGSISPVGHASATYGALSFAPTARSTAVGALAQALADGSTAIGSFTEARGENSVALGTGSVAPDANTVSVGGQSVGTRRITNVADGIAPTDAVTVRQLDRAVDGVEKKANRGVAAALAIPHLSIASDDTFVLGTSAGYYDGESAVGIAGAYRVNRNLSVDVGASMPISSGAFGARVGAQWSFR